MKRFFQVYGRVLGFLRPHRRAAATLCAANLALASIGFIEPRISFLLIIQLRHALCSSSPERDRDTHEPGARPNRIRRDYLFHVEEEPGHPREQ